MLFLLQDGITNGAIYALLGLALVLVFAVTRVILIPQGEFVTYGALSYAMLATGQVPGTARLAVAMGVVAFGLDLFVARKSLRLPRVARSVALNIVFPVAILALATALAGPTTPIAVNIALALLIVAAIGLFLYRIAFQPIAHTSVLVLLIASVGCHLALQGLGLVFFGAEGLRGPALSNAALTDRSAALHRPEHRGLWPDHRLHRRAVAVLRLYADGQGAARHRRQPPRRAAGRHPDHAVGTDRLPAGIR